MFILRRVATVAAVTKGHEFVLQQSYKEMKEKATPAFPTSKRHVTRRALPSVHRHPGGLQHHFLIPAKALGSTQR